MTGFNRASAILPIQTSHLELSFQMSDYICWLCDRKKDRKSDLKHHLTSIHDRLKLVCAWCEGRELTFRKAVDLKLHVKTNHKIIFREAPSDCFGEPNSFWFAKYPKDYIRIIKPTRRDSVEARFSRRAIEKWWPSSGNRAAKSLAEWKEGWSCVPLLTPSPSPMLDFLEDRPIPARLAIHRISIGSDQIDALVYEEFKNVTIWYRCLLKSSILTVQRQRDSLLRRIDQIQPHKGVVPEAFETELDGERFKFAINRLCNVLKVETSYFAAIYKQEQSSFPEQKQDESKSKAIDEPQEPLLKKRKTIHHSQEPMIDLTEVGEPADTKQGGSMPKAEEKVSGTQQNKEITTVVDDDKMARKGKGTSEETPTKKRDKSKVTNRTPDVNTECERTVTVNSTGKPKPLLPLDILLPEPTPSADSSSHNMEPAEPEKLFEAVKCTQASKSDVETPLLIHEPQGTGCMSTSDQPLIPEESPSQTSSDIESKSMSVEDSASNSESNISIPLTDGPPIMTSSLTLSTGNQISTIATVKEVVAAVPSYCPESPALDVNEKGDGLVKVKSSSRYVPTPKCRVPKPLPAITLRAEALLCYGCMPLLAPTRRNWSEEEAIVLPSTSPVSTWPPKGWFGLTPDVKLLMWETVATSLALSDGLDLERGGILDAFNFLALPGSKDPVIKTNLQSARYYNFKAVRDVYIGRSTCEMVITMLEAAIKCSMPSPSASVILKQIERKRINIRF